MQTYKVANSIRILMGIVAYPAFLTPELRNVESPYGWRCFEKKYVHYKCEEYKSDDPKLPNADISITVNSEDGDYDYHGRRAWPMPWCLDLIWEFQKVAREQKIVCLLGDSTDRFDRPSLPFQYRSWTWDQLRTAKGCVSWFGQHCEDTHRAEN